MNHKTDIENYRNMSEPFTNRIVAKERIVQFLEDVGELRKKHRIADVLVSARVLVVEGDKEGAVTTHVHFGDASNAALMAATILGREEAAREQLIADLVTGKAEHL